MNLGKVNNEQSFDATIERINKKIAKILGKKNNNSPKSGNTSNKTFIIIIISMLLLLWFSTGFYYLSDKQSGIVITNGKITKIINGIKVGFVLPYPFSDIEIIDTGVSDFIKISKDDALDNYTTLSKDLVPVGINAKFSYQVIDPKLLFLNILQKNDNLNDVVKFQIWQELHSEIAKNNKDDIARKNLTVMSSDVKSAVNQNLTNLGIVVVKLQIDMINYSGGNMSVETINKATASAPIVADKVPLDMPSIAVKVLDAANKYRADKMSETELNINKFNQLLPQYLQNPEGIAEQMYYDMLEKVPIKKDDDYQLLNTKLSDLLLQKEIIIIPTMNNPSLERNLGREVDRNRDIDGR